MLGAVRQKGRSGVTARAPAFSTKEWSPTSSAHLGSSLKRGSRVTENPPFHNPGKETVADLSGVSRVAEQHFIRFTYSALTLSRVHFPSSGMSKLNFRHMRSSHALSVFQDDGLRR